MGGCRTVLSLVIKLLCLLYFVGAYDPSTCIQCRKSHVCNPPDCFCCRDTMPMETHNIPQMVFFTFDDAVNPAVAKHYKDLFDASRLNPNGCPVRMTLFISHRNTVYSYVRDFYERGMEIASHSVTHSHPNSHTFLREAKKQKENLAKKAKIPESEIVGWRSPFLEPLGDTQPKVLKQLGYKYDATLTITKKSNTDKAITPFTLDHGWPYDCKIKPCPSQSHNGFWEVPVVSVKDYKNKYDCVYIDACHSPPPSESAAYKFLWDNFQRYYSTNRAPMGINMHASWFYYPDRKAAMDKFIKQLVKMDDVYILTVKQVIEWLKDPTPLNKIKAFKPWQCGANANETIGVSDTQALNTPAKVVNDMKTIGTKIQPIQVKEIKPTLQNQNQFTQNTQRQQTFTPAPMQTRMLMQNNAWQMQRQNQMQNNGFNRQQVGPTAVPFRQTSAGMQTQVWSQGNMNGLPPIPIPPMSPNFPAVRFWWRPPTMVDQQTQLELQRREAIRRQRMLQEQQQTALQQAQLQSSQRETMLRRQEMIEKRRQNMLLQQKAEEERLRKEKIEKQRQEELKRQEILKLKEIERKTKEEKKRQMEQAEKRKQEELAGQELLKQQQIEQQRQEEQLRKERLKQEQLEKQRLEELARQESLKQQQLEKQRIEEQMRQDLIKKQMLEKQRQEELARQELLKQQRLEQQTLEEQARQDRIKQQQEDRHGELRQEIIAKQNQEELMQRRHQKEHTSAQFIQEKQIITKPDTGSIKRSIKPPNEIEFANKLDQMLSRDKKDRIAMLQQMSLNELRLLQLEVNRRMGKSNKPLRPRGPVFESTDFVNSKQNMAGAKIMTSLNQNNVKESIQENYSATGAGHMVEQLVTSVSVYPETYKMAEIASEIVTATTTHAAPTTTTVSEDTTTANVNRAPRPSTVSVGHQFDDSNHISVTEKPRTIVQQKTIPMQYTITTTPTADTFKHGNNKPQDVPFFNFIRPKLSQFEHKSAEKSSARTSGTTARTSVWNMDTFDIKSLHGPWKRKRIVPMPKPETTTNKTVRKTSLKLLPVAITLFNTDTYQQPKPQLSYRSFTRPNLFNPEETNTNLFTDEAVPVSAGPTIENPQETDYFFQNKKPYTFSEPVNIIPLQRKRQSSPGRRIIVKTISPASSNPTPTRLSTTSATTTTISTTTTTSTTTTAAPPSTTTTIRSTTKTPPVKPTQQVSKRQFTPQSKNVMTLVPIPTQWRLDKLGGPVAIPPYRPFPSSRRPQQSSSNRNPLGCKQGENCALPNCFCKTDSVPAGMKLREIPQMVYITIDGSLNFHGLAKIRKLFSGRTNPNGCKVKGTMFITDAGSSYRISNLLLNDGIELAMMGMSSRPYATANKLTTDILLQRQRISDSSNLPKENVHGWRSPGFKVLGDDQFNFMANESLYDSSLVLDRSSRDKRKVWPFTLDYGLNEHCEIGQCPSKRHQGMWEVPVIPYVGPDNSTTCEYVDGCTTQPKTVADTFNYLMDNFNMHYKTNRAPFAIRLKQIWFHWYYRENMKGLFSFLDTVLGYGDVYLSSISDMLKWIKNPVKLETIGTFKPWKC